MKELQPRKVDKPLVLYGYGKLGHLAEEIFNELNIPIFKILDKTINEGRKNEWKKSCLIAVCIATKPYTSLEKVWIANHLRYLGIWNYLRDFGWEDIVPVWDIIEAYPEVGLHNGWTFTPTKEDQFHAKHLAQHVYKDITSRVQYRTWRLWRKQHIDERLFSHKINIQDRYQIPEVMSAIRLFDRYHSEQSGFTLADVRARQKVQIFSKPYNYIELHAEGYELQSLEANLSYLQEYRPILCVTVYHSRDGLWKIPFYLYQNLKNYSFLFRMHAYMGQSAVLYCIPNERR
jgi:hypothetical protein